MSYHQITAAERYTLGLLRQQGLAPAAIARLMGRHRSTIGRELARNRTAHDGAYRPQVADWYARGRKVCFTGTAREVRSLKWGAERAAGGSIALDSENCVSEFKSYGRKGFEELGERFTTLVGANETYTLQYGEESQRFYSGFNPANRTATILRGDYIGGFYSTGNRFTCAVFGGHSNAPQSFGALIAHELIGHGTVGGNEPEVRRIENLYHAAYGQPARCR